MKASGPSTNARRAARKLQSQAVDPLGGAFNGKKPNASQLAEMLGMDPRAALVMQDAEQKNRKASASSLFLPLCSPARLIHPR